MHAVFIPYGEMDVLDRLKKELQCQSFKLPIYNKDGSFLRHELIAGNLRLLPFGIWEFIFPKEYKDIVLSSLDFDTKDCRYEIPEFYLKIARKVLRILPIPEFKKGTQKGIDLMIISKENIAFIPFGIREDLNVTMEDGTFHEGI